MAILHELFFDISAFVRFKDCTIQRSESVKNLESSKVLSARRFEKLEVGEFKFQKLKKTRNRKFQRF